MLNIGCQDHSGETADPLVKPPKPVSTMVLRKSRPSYQHHTMASVAPWKAERIGFEQAGRVIQVIEPSEMVEAKGVDGKVASGKGVDRKSGRIGGGAVARLDDEQFRIAVDAAKADAAVAERRRDSNLISIEQRLPSVVKTAVAELKLAESELARAERIANSISKSELETARTRASTAKLQVASAKSEYAQASAEQLALEAQVRQANQRVAEAERNLKNTTLFSSFPGQVAEIHVVPGTYVKEGDPIVTVQMVDPMLVEFEVTADNSRLYRRGDTLGVTVTNTRGEQQTLSGMVYTVDTLADINTRTFTVSLHVRNQTETESNNSVEPDGVARTKDIYPLNLGPIVTGDSRLLVEQNAIHQIKGENYVWKVTNRDWSKLSNAANRELIVQRLKVEVASDVIPFLGSWNFVAIKFEDPAVVNLDQDLITGKLFFNNADDKSSTNLSLENWRGDRVSIEQTRWMLRAGDTVRVALIPESSAQGFYVPMKAVRRENGKTFIHVVDETQDPQADSTATASRVMINVMSDDSVSDDILQLRIESATEGELQEGSRIVVGGTHYLNDGDQVRIVPSAGKTRTSAGGR